MVVFPGAAGLPLGYAIVQKRIDGLEGVDQVVPAGRLDDHAFQKPV